MKYYFLQHTMAPYRISLFNKLYELGLNFEVLYMDELESCRSWVIDKTTIKYPYTLVDGYKGELFGHSIYCCPQFVNRFIKEQNVKIVLGGSWNFPDVIITCVLKRIRVIKNEVLFWSEANYLTNGARKKSLMKSLLRRFVLGTGEGRAIVPGKMAIDTFSKWGLKNKSFIRLPNVIEEDLFEKLYQEKQKSFSAMSDVPKFIMPVRLNEKVKGILNFFRAIGPENVHRAHYFVLGDGPDEHIIRKFVYDNDYGNNIEIVGFCQMDKVVDYYSACDALILPSFSDPSPLSLVEACCCKMPILASNRCGNHFETVEDTKNGYLFSPTDHFQIRSSFEALLNCREEWPSMGQYSRDLFDRNFKQSVVLPEFVKQLTPCQN